MSFNIYQYRCPNLQAVVHHSHRCYKQTFDAEMLQTYIYIYIIEGLA